MKATQLMRLSAAATLAGLLALLSACGGGGSLAGLDSAEGGSWPQHSWEAAQRSGSFRVLAVDDTERQVVDLTSQLSLDVEETAEGTYVHVLGSNLAPANHAFLHLAYDPALLSPVSAGAGDVVARDSVFISVTGEPGLVAMGIGTIGGADLISGDVELAQVFFAHGPALMLSRGVSSVAQSPVNSLQWDGIVPNKLLWKYRNTGDYDQNRQVGISDITPIGIHLGKSSGDSDWFKAEPADGDGNGLINISDITPIGVNYTNQVSQYRIDSAGNASGPFSSDGSMLVQYEDNIKPAAGGFLTFEFTINPAPAQGTWFAVVAMDAGNAASAHSNSVVYSGAGGGIAAPQNLTGTINGDNFQLSWDPPATGTPDGYQVYVSGFSNMGGSQQVNTEPVVGTNYIVPSAISPTGIWFFAVTAVAGTDESSYSNIWTNGSETDQTPPEWNPGEEGIKAATPGDTTVNVEWYVAADPSPPVTYNIYYAPTGSGIDWNTPQLTGKTGLSFMVTGLTNGTGYDFGVRAVDSALNVTTNTNFLAATPNAGIDNTAPGWIQGEGIKTAEPDDTLVRVSWYNAVDASNPPVSYLLYYVEDTADFDWDSPQEVFGGAVTETNVIGLTNDQRYKFAVKAQDSAAPPNRTTNENFLYATPQIFPSNGSIGSVIANDTTSVRMPGEEVPRIFSVDRQTALNYTTWNGSAWTTLDLNTILANPDRKYHPQSLAVGNDIHLVFGTANAIYEMFGDKDSDPSTWTLSTIANTGISNMYGIGFAHSNTDNYFAVVYATNNGGDKLYYSERDAAASWSIPVSIMDGTPEIWQCDMTINDSDGSQWVVAASGELDNNQIDQLKWYYLQRPNRVDAFTGGLTGYGGDVMVVEIDPNFNLPVVVNAEVDNTQQILGQTASISHAVVYTWNGTSWVKNLLESGSATFNSGDFTYDTVLAGQDPQLIFTPTGKAIALWSTLDFNVDILDSSGTMTGAWNYSERPDTAWSSPQQLLPNISSSNSVTAGESYQHCVTCDLGFVDQDDVNNLVAKYSQRNNYVEGDLYYKRSSWN